jgi:hypothetical protein
VIKAGSVKSYRRHIYNLVALDRRLVQLSNAGVKVNRTHRKSLQWVLSELRMELAWLEAAAKQGPPPVLVEMPGCDGVDGGAPVSPEPVQPSNA